MSEFRKWMGCVSGAAALALLLGPGTAMAQQDTTAWGQDTAQTQIGQDTAQVENEITVTLRDGQIEMPDSVESGVTLFTVVNEGSEEHSLVIQGKDVGETRIDPAEEETPPAQEQQQEEGQEQEFGMGEEGEFMESIGRNLSAGESETLVTNLAPGEYVAWCPVDDHREQGMEVTFTVKEKEQKEGEPR